METLHPDFEQLKDEGIEPEQVILYKLLSMFGPVPFELITHINDEYWGELVTALSEAIADSRRKIRLCASRSEKKKIFQISALKPRG